MDRRETSVLACERNFRLGDWLIEPSLGQLRNGSREEKLEPKVMQVLVFMAKRAGKTVSRDDLIEAAWNGSFVSEDAVNRCISRLRRVFRDDPGVRIETLPKIGYRLLATVGPFVDTSQPSAPQTNLASAQPAETVRVDLGLRGSDQVRLVVIASVGLAVIAIALVATALWRKAPDELSDFRVTPFTSLPGHEGAASFSPDGSHITFAWRQPGKTESDVYVKAIGSEEVRRLTDSPDNDTSPAWSPDGTRIAFVRIKDGKAHVILISPLGGAERQLTTFAAPGGTELTWRPSGETIAFSGQSELGGRYRILSVSVANPASINPLTDPPHSWIGDEYPSFSPDGSRLAFVRTRAHGVSDVHLLDLATKRVRRLTHDNLKIHGLAWESDGSGLVFSSNRGGGFSLWNVRLDGSKPRPLPSGGRHADWVAVASRGHRLVYQEWIASCSIVRLDLASGREIMASDLGGAVRFHWDPELSPDGRRLAFISDRSGSAEVWVSDSSGDHRLQITSFGGAYTKTVKWSPDGRLLALTAPPDGHFDVFVADPNGSFVTRLTTDASDDYAPAWSPDGQTLYFSSNRSGHWEIWSMTRDGKDPRQITHRGGKAALPSLDGKWLYYVKPDQPGIWKQPLQETAAETVVIPDFYPVDWNNWEVTEDGIYFVVRPSLTATAVHLYDPKTGQSREITSVPALHYDSGIDVSPDGHSILISTIARSESDLILVEYRK